MHKLSSVAPATLILCEIDAAQRLQPLTPQGCANILKHSDEYAQVAQENQNLIWLYILILQDEIELPRGEVISAMKQRLLEENSLTPLAWQYVANGTADDFRVVLDSQDPGDEPQWRWHTLVAWLQVLSGLRLRAPVPEPIQELFLHDGLVVDSKNGEVNFRGAWMKFDTLRRILDEAKNRLATGALEQFSETELVEVITWLAATSPVFKKNQKKHGWKYLSREAEKWKADTVMMAAYQDLKWDSALPQMQIEQWTIDPVIDAWSLHRLAISQRHCGDKFIDGCIAGTERIFVICDRESTTVATLRLKRVDGCWAVGDVRGFANSGVSAEIGKLGVFLAQRYSDHEYFQQYPLDQAEGMYR